MLITPFGKENITTLFLFYHFFPFFWVGLCDHSFDKSGRFQNFFNERAGESLLNFLIYLVKAFLTLSGVTLWIVAMIRYTSVIESGGECLRMIWACI